MEKYKSHLRLRRNILVCFALFAAASGIFDVFFAPEAAKDSAVFEFQLGLTHGAGILSLLCGALWLVNIFLPRVEPLHSILMVVTLVFCVALLISHLCYTLSRDDKNKK